MPVDAVGVATLVGVLVVAGGLSGQQRPPDQRQPSNARRAVRAARDHIGLARMTHTWRRTYATILHQEVTLFDRAKADLLGQAKFLHHPDPTGFIDAACDRQVSRD
jgi:hypothetical protein